MCLTLKKTNSNKPFNKKNIRWKAVYLTFNGDFTGPYQGITYKKKGWNKAFVRNLNEKTAGFHVMTTYNGASGIGSPRKIEVRGFLRSGYFRNCQCETWKEFRFVDEGQ